MMNTPATMLVQAEATASLAHNRRQAIQWARKEANAIMAQKERQLAGWDKGLYRDDDMTCTRTILWCQTMRSLTAFALSVHFPVEEG